MNEVSLPGIIIFIVLHEESLFIEGFIPDGSQISDGGVHLSHLQDLIRHMDCDVLVVHPEAIEDIDEAEYESC